MTAPPEKLSFVVLCLARTGSTHLVDLLDSHPGIRCYGELLNATHPDAAPEGWLGDLEGDVSGEVEALLARTDSPVCGFKLPLNSLRDRPEMVDWLRRSTEVRVLRLKRRNALALLLSRRMLRATLVSQSVYGSYGETTVHIDPAECVRALELIERDDAELDDLAAPHPSLEVAYEELGEEAAVAGVQRFLGVEPASLTSGYERLRRRPFERTISNWEELSAALAKTRFAPLLDE